MGDPKERWDDHEAWRGNCYEAGFKYLLDNPDAVLVHGYPLGRGPANRGIRYGHAWIEKGDMVYDVTVPQGHLGFPKPFYYALGNLTEDHVYRYDKIAAFGFASRFQHYGPWEGPERRPPYKGRRRKRRMP